MDGLKLQALVSHCIILNSASLIPMHAKEQKFPKEI